MVACNLVSPFMRPGMAVRYASKRTCRTVDSDRALAEVGAWSPASVAHSFARAGHERDHVHLLLHHERCLLVLGELLDHGFLGWRRDHRRRVQRIPVLDVEANARDVGCHLLIIINIIVFPSSSVATTSSQASSSSRRAADLTQPCSNSLALDKK